MNQPFSLGHLCQLFSSQPQGQARVQGRESSPKESKGYLRPSVSPWTERTAHTFSHLNHPKLKKLFLSLPIWEVIPLPEFTLHHLIGQHLPQLPISPPTLPAERS